MSSNSLTSLAILVFEIKLLEMETLNNLSENIYYSKIWHFNRKTSKEGSLRASIVFNQKEKSVISTIKHESGECPLKVLHTSWIVRRDTNLDPIINLHFKNTIASDFHLATFDELYDNPEFCSSRKTFVVVMKIVVTFEPTEETKNYGIKATNKKMLEEGLFTDLIVESSDNIQFKAHKSILCSRSEYFKRMFLTEMKENTTGVWKINDLNSLEVKEFLNFIYCGELNNISWIEMELYVAAERYDLEELKVLCLNSMYKSLCPNNVIKFVVFASYFTDLTIFYYNCIELIYA